jgi:3-deoxy-manno-octulosonate cytidylyltransferase (CMP-KDO synthetase)
MEALENSGTKADFIVNLQGDLIAPPHFIKALIETYKADKAADIVTPVVQLDWTALDKLRQAKAVTPFSGTTVTIDKDQYALWFSKNIIPALRKEEKLRDLNPHSPVFRHIGMYGYSYNGLKKYVSLPHAHYEGLEGLEQLRALENGMKIKCVAIDYGAFPAFPGIDSPEDLARAEALLQ